MAQHPKCHIWVSTGAERRVASNVLNHQYLLQGSHFLKFVLEAAGIHFASAHFEKLSVPQKFGPTFFTTMFVSKACNAREVKSVPGPVWRPKGDDD